MTTAQKLSQIYKATQCCDVTDCDYAIEAVKEMARNNGMDYTPAMRQRLASLSNKRDQLVKAGKL